MFKAKLSLQKSIDTKALEKRRKLSRFRVSVVFSLQCLVVRKIDFHLILPLFVFFVFNILDRSNIANARLGGLQKDLKLSDTPTSDCCGHHGTHTNIQSCRLASCLDIAQFVGYLGGQIPSNILMTRIRPSIYLPIVIFIWGGLSICTTGVHIYAGVLAFRILLGLAESSFFSGAS